MERRRTINTETYKTKVHDSRPNKEQSTTKTTTPTITRFRLAAGQNIKNDTASRRDKLLPKLYYIVIGILTLAGLISIKASNLTNNNNVSIYFSASNQSNKTKNVTTLPNKNNTNNDNYNNYSSSTFGDSNGLPYDFILHGSREKYTPVPDKYRHTFKAEGKDSNVVTATLLKANWTETELPYTCHIYDRFRNHILLNHFLLLEPWQRYGRVPGAEHWDPKDKFLAGFRRYQQQTPNADLYFLPESYRLSDPKEREYFQAALYNQGGINVPWVLKQAQTDRGLGIQVLGPNSKELISVLNQTDAKRTQYTYVIQKYICNELTWFDGAKFDLRFYWAIMSIDPLIVAFHDGHARVSATKYNETDFSSTSQHLTNLDYRNSSYTEDTSDDLWRLIRAHHSQNTANHMKEIIIEDPVAHVRNQMKEAISTLVAAFKDVYPDSRKQVVPENLYAFHGCDFVVDNDLDVYILEAQASAGLDTRHEYKFQMYGRILKTLIDTVEEISMKQEKDAKGNLFPLMKLGNWEIVYAGDWQYKYDGYKRPKQKASCLVESA